MEASFAALIEIEREAVEIRNKALKWKEQSECRMANTEALTENYLEQANKRILELEQNEQRKLEKQFAEIDSRLKSSITQLEQYAREHKDEWVDRLYRAVLELPEG